MKFNPSQPAQLIEKQSALEAILPELSEGAYLAVDTESNSLFAYQEQVCLIQFSNEKTDYLIDTLADLDLSCLHAVFSDPKLEKVFHAAEYDIVCLKRDFGFEFNALFDTMQAARILGFKHLGLSKLLEDQFKIDSVKSFQKANWGKRPLTQLMRQYARLDTHYLIPLREKLEKQLQKNGLLELAQEDFERLCKVENNHNKAPLYTQINGYHHLSQRQLTVLDALCRYRDSIASQLDRPLFKVIGARVLFSLAEASPKTLDELENIKDLSSRMASKYGDGLIAAIQLGLRAPLIVLPTYQRLSRDYINRVENLKLWRKNRGKKMGVQSDIVLPKDILEDIAGKHPKELSALKDMMKDVPWRYQHYGEEILQVIV
ncbi:MAG: HRDC domain-containing protein [Pelolinea sp.]|nr:HRDC domain-containing protein [Pelolinea sp.]